MPLSSISGAGAWARPGETTDWKLQTENSTALLTGFAIRRRADQARSRVAQAQQLRRQTVAMHIAGRPVRIEEVLPLSVGALVAERLVADAAEALGQKVPPLAERGMMEFGHLAQSLQDSRLRGKRQKLPICIAVSALSVEKRGVWGVGFKLRTRNRWKR
jgi:hypothetical protein